jgi:hydrogenase maturation protein HypF
VARLRARKRRDEKPFAVMVATPAEAAAVAMMSSEERDLLVSVERPIVLMQRRADGPLAANVAPFSPFVGVMLPYTPLHHLLLARVQRPLVMTSGNVSDEPIACENADALARLGGIADLFLLHDRDIATACDDSVAMVIKGRPVVWRRSRGFVPAPIAVRPAFDATVLACGALLKNTFCLSVGRDAYLGPHIGDLANLAGYQRFADAIDAMQRFLRVRPEIIAYDLHPEYLSTRYALARPEPIKVGVQHHHAHVVSAMVEHDLREPVIGVAYDGTGHGLDGTAWGGEVLVARRAAFERVATLRPIPLAGGDQAIRQPWRIALALLHDAFGADAPLEALPLFRAIGGKRVDFVRRMIAGGVNAPLAHGAGRYFDGIASLALARPDSAYEGQLALWWNGLAGSDERTYGFSIDRSTTPWTIDLRAMVREVVRELSRGVPVESISAGFHNTLVAATAAAVRLTADAHGTLPVVLSGGCFQNRRLAEGIASRLASRFEVHLHERVPPGDGGIALGQAVVAAAVARGR